MRVTEAEWLAATDAEPMLAFLRDKASERKLMLFLSACNRRIRPLSLDDQTRLALEAQELCEDGFLPSSEPRKAYATRMKASGPAFRLYTARLNPKIMDLALRRQASSAAHGAARAVDAEEGMAWRQVREAQCRILREIAFDPFRPAPAVHPAWLAWRDGAVPQLAQAAYDERRLPDGILDPARLAMLADALEDAGCTDADLLGHLRSPGPHVRGCWAVDLVLGKS
jgi:hypothetical protein